ncbi:YcgL domain-containing protein [Methylomonas sp. LL1]|uniref:YcgL domain-containing protein n=1 Tax=Methylomonas sp. LL1 TaxID=2785785 RepID=UPI0018C405BC|nr:YcgL domain-containing protein [Methylomonas sp. LL1]QPK62783.1 YcgL domain-containing protein [Methylomonas sp. LL1]
MQCFIYKSLKKDQLYLYLDKKDDFSSLPPDLFQSLGRLEFVMELQLSPQRKLAREDAVKVIAGLESKGFYIQMPPVMVPSRLLLANNQLH